VPTDFEISSGLLNRVLDDAFQEADRTGVMGHELTPFLLAHMAKRSGGATLRTNIALLENNARVAAEIARTLV
jgi:pseudouridylate synthase